MTREEKVKELTSQGWKLVRGSELIYEQGDKELYIESDFDGNVVDVFISEKVSYVKETECTGRCTDSRESESGEEAVQESGCRQQAAA